MYARPHRIAPGHRQGSSPLAWWSTAACVLAAGCAVPPHVQQTRDAPLFDDVTNIMAFIRPKPWINFDPSDPTKVNGLAINMYLISASTQKGVFGSGTIRVVLLEDEPSQAGEGSEAGGPEREPKKVHEWALSPEQAMPYRVMRRPNRRYAMGAGYQLRLSWGDADLRHRRVKVILKYERADGLLVVRKPFHLHIPASG